jgi:hypothetical protein
VKLVEEASWPADKANEEDAAVQMLYVNLTSSFAKLMLTERPGGGFNYWKPTPRSIVAAFGGRQLQYPTITGS